MFGVLSKHNYKDFPCTRCPFARDAGTLSRHCIQSWRMQVYAGGSTLICPCVVVHKRTSLMSYSLFHHLFPTCFARLTWIVWEMGDKWPKNRICSKQHACILGKFPTIFFSWHFVKILQVAPYDSTVTATAGKNSRFIVSGSRFPLGW